MDLIKAKIDLHSPLWGYITVVSRVNTGYLYTISIENPPATDWFFLFLDENRNGLL